MPIISQILKGYDIIILQETHVDESKSSLFNFFKKKNCLFTKTSSNKLGVAIILNDNIQFLEPIIDPNGRFILIQIHWPIKVKILAVYAPADKQERPSFLLEIDRLIDKDTMLVGDLNTSYRPCDKSSTATFSMRKDRQYLIDIIEKNSFIDLGANSPEFTFRSNRSTFCRIDYALIPLRFIECVSNFRVDKTVPFNFDHFPISFNFKTGLKTNRSPRWIFNDLLLDDPIFFEKVKQLINHKRNYSWSRIKNDIKNLALSYSRKSSLIQSLRLEWINTYLEIHFMNPDEKFKSLLLEKEEILRKQQASLAVKIRTSMDKNADIPSPLLSSLLKSRAQENNIQIEAEKISDYYNELHGKFPTNYSPDILQWCKKIDEFTKIEMDMEISTEEILLAITRLPNGTSPGSDGFTSTFYKRFSKEIAPLLLKELKSSLSEGSLSQDMRTAIIRLIPKKGGDLNTVKGYRPISLVNTDAKIFSENLSCLITRRSNCVCQRKKHSQSCELC
jgi:exonuclease III